MKVGDLVRWSKTSQIGIAIDIFGDLDPADPWIRVVFQKGEQQTHPMVQERFFGCDKKRRGRFRPLPWRWYLVEAGAYESRHKLFEANLITSSAESSL